MSVMFVARSAVYGSREAAKARSLVRQIGVTGLRGFAASREHFLLTFGREACR